MMTPVLFILAGLVVLVLGAESLVRGAASLALRMGVSALVVGLTIVACGTSTPELAVSAIAASNGSPDIAIGNVVGSNIFNIAVILGIAALICPIACNASFIRRETPLMIGVSLLLPALAWIGGRFGGGLAEGQVGVIGRPAGVVLLTLGVGYTALLYWLSKRESAQVAEEFEAGATPGETAAHARRRPLWADLLYIAVGLGLLVLGSRFLVDGATSIARTLGVSELAIGLTIVAGGTSLPELATSVVAAIRKQPDIAVGNVVGSNIFNILFILGATSMIAPVGVSHEVMVRDIPVMLVIAALCLPIMATGRRINRLEGAILLALFAAYTVWLMLSSGGA